MKIQTLLNSHLGTAVGLGVSRMLPLRLGYPFAQKVADFFAVRRRSPIVQAVRANQWVVHGGKISPTELDHLVIETFRSSARSMYEFWHNFSNPSTVLNMVDVAPEIDQFFQSVQQTEQGTLLVTPHMSNFDLVGRALTLHGLTLHVISYPQPPGGYRWQNQLRESNGLRVTPMSINAVREASETLRAGHIVVTGADRPLPHGEDAKYRPRFFGRAAAMPVFYIRLAIKHNLPISVVGACRQPNGCYQLFLSDPIPMIRNADLVKETVQNAEAVLAVIAGFIRRAPEQWAMFYPAWPEVYDQVPT